MTEALTRLVKEGYTVRRVRQELEKQGYTVSITDLELVRWMLRIRKDLGLM